MERIFPTKFDGWLVGAVTGGFLIGAVSLWTAWWSTRAAGVWIGVALYAAGLMLVVWMLTSTRYVVGTRLLVVHSGPFRWHVPLEAIVRLEETRDPASAPAWSLDRLRIHYSNGQSVMVSPLDKTGFIAALGRGVRKP